MINYRLPYNSTRNLHKWQASKCKVLGDQVKRIFSILSGFEGGATLQS